MTPSSATTGQIRAFRDKYLAALFAGMIICISSFAQVDTTRDLPKRSASFADKHLQADSSIVFPKDTFRLKSTWNGIAFKNGVPYFWDGTKYSPFSTSDDSTNIITVKNVSDLRANGYYSISSKKKSSNDKPFVTVAGYYQPNDGGGGQFYWDDTATVADNGGTIIKPTAVSGAGRWKLIFDRELNVLQFGAKRDFTLSGGTDASMIFRTALAAMQYAPHATVFDQDSSKGILRIPGGVYRMDSTIYVNSNVIIRGGGGMTGNTTTTSETRLVWMTQRIGIQCTYDSGCKSVEIHDLWLKTYGVDNTNQSDSGAHGLYIKGSRFNITGVHCDNWGGNGFYIDSHTGGNSNNGKIIGCTAFYCGKNGLELYGQESNNIDVRDCDFSTNARCGVFDNSFLGNNYWNCHTSFNGLRAGSPYRHTWARKGSGTSTVFYQCLGNTGSDATTKAWNKGINPGVTSGWQDYWAVSARTWALSDSNFVPVWSADSTYFVCGSYFITGTNCYSSVYGSYSEGGQGANFLNGYSQANGGDQAADFTSPTMCFMGPDQGRFKIPSGLYVADRDSTTTEASLSPLFGLQLTSRKAGHAGVQARYYEDIREVKFFNNNTLDSVHLSILGTGHSGANFGLAQPTGVGVVFPYLGHFMIDHEQLDYGRRIMATKGVAPTYGVHAAGEWCVDIGTDTTIVGYRCTVGGTPGTWVAIKSANKPIRTQGADVSSANNFVPGVDGDVFEVTGTTQINLISNTGRSNGDEITLLFTSTPTVKTGQTTSGSNITIQLAGGVDFSATANDVLVLQLCEIGGTQMWREKSRSIN